ncbi:hypothetical protein IFM46972_06606 [Aspergillus udagawae]|uniref:Uncharacterized protein n=1 Tax=Aspergillus udagawae TaxID=91492 RepID=A0A8H3NWR6_9EURO|nr:hypothetical protein IFM46972_06606 [Aspergillus udagawae]
MMQNDRSLDRRTTRVQYRDADLTEIVLSYAGLPPPKGTGPSCTLHLRNTGSAAEYYTFLFAIQRTGLSLVVGPSEFTSHKSTCQCPGQNTDSAAALSCPHPCKGT